LRRVLPRDELERAVAKGEVLRLAIGPLPGFLHEPTRSVLERHFLRLCRRHRIPDPEVNVRIGPYEVDLFWREARVIVEADGWRYHGGRVAFEADRARDARLKARGYEVLRFTWRHVTGEPSTVASLILSVLDHAEKRAARR
jgi:very-short-patch-repair endonuclease